jgi:hypothetical protein
MSQHTLARSPRPTSPPDPWGRRARSNDPRLSAFASARRTAYGQTIDLSAALWGGHHARSVTLTAGEAYELGLQLVALAVPGLRPEEQRQGMRDALRGEYQPPGTREVMRAA